MRDGEERGAFKGGGGVRERGQPQDTAASIVCAARTRTHNVTHLECEVADAVDRKLEEQ
jgi:hypothetical protein